MLSLLIMTMAVAQEVRSLEVRTTIPATLPPSLRAGALAACAPATLEAAEACLTSALSPEDLAIVQDRIPARRFRPPLDCQIEKEWRLGDPNSPMARVMFAKLGFNHPGMAAGMIISDIQAKAAGTSVPWVEMRQSFRGKPPEPASSTCDVKIERSKSPERGNDH
jgi:hypothetical protein